MGKKGGFVQAGGGSWPGRNSTGGHNRSWMSCSSVAFGGRHCQANAGDDSFNGLHLRARTSS